MYKKIVILLSLNILLYINIFGQHSILDIINREDITYNQTIELAETFFDSIGRGQGSGYKMFERWKFNRKFETDSNGYYIRPDAMKAMHNQFTNAMPVHRTLGTFNELGPFSWNCTSSWSPGLGRISAVAVNQIDTTQIYVGSPGGGFWKSINSGATWTPLTDFNYSYMFVGAIAIDPINTNIVYVGATNGGIGKSTDGGATITNLGGGLYGIKKIIIDPSNANIIYTATTYGVHKSINGGTTWTNVLNLNIEDIEFLPGNSNILIASGVGGAGVSSLHRSTDGGTTWTALTTLEGITHTDRTLVSVCAAAPNIVYAVQAAGSGFGRLYKSIDGGASFTTTVIGDYSTNTNYFGSTGGQSGGQAWYDMAMEVNPSNANDIYIAGIIVWRSTNGGTTFSQMTAWTYPNGLGYNHGDVLGLFWVKNTLYSCSDGGIFKSMDYADNWTNISTGLGIRQLYRIATAKTDANIMCAGSQDNGTAARTNTGTWRDWLGADGMDCIIDPNNANIMVGTWQYGGIYKTLDGGLTSTYIPTPAGGNWVTPLAWHPTKSSTIYGGWDSIYMSTNAGSNWRCISKGVNTGKLDVLHIAHSDTNYIYAAKGNVLFKTTNAGLTWTTDTLTSTITSIEVKHNNPLKIWVTLSNGASTVQVSYDGGDSFTPINAGLPPYGSTNIVVDDLATEGIYVAMGLGVYYKDLVNTSWTLLATGLPEVSIREIEISKIAGKLRVATYGRGIWETNLINNTSLPLNFLSFQGVRNNNDILLQWHIANVTDNSNYVVQYSTNGITYSNIGTINTNPTNTFNFTHYNAPKGNVYYRIMYKENQRTLYSNIILVRGINNSKKLQILQNPVQSNLQFSVKIAPSKEYVYNIYTTQGQLKYSTKTNNSYIDYAVSNYTAGAYILEINIDGILYKEKFTIIH
jgi:hypothetical protein